MKLRALAALVIPFLFAVSAQAFSSGSGAEASPTPTLLDHTLLILHLKHAPRPKNPPQLHHGMELQLGINPTPIKLSENREVKVTVTVFNRSPKNYVHLNFPTTQRVEILVKDSSGKVVNTWSEDQSFTSDPASVTINPGERLEYTELVATREMSGGQPYTIEVSFPSYPDLKIQQQVVPEK